MFRTIILALLVVELGLPLIGWILGWLFSSEDDDSSIGCGIVGAIILLVIILL